MKYKSLFYVSLALLFLTGCGRKEPTSENLIGTWTAIKINNDDISKQGFKSIQMQISKDSLKIEIQAELFGGEVTTRSEGTWKFENGFMNGQLGEANFNSKLKMDENTLIFEPDPQFRPETVFSTEYVRLQ